MKHLCGFQLDHVEKILQELSLISDGQNITDLTLERQKLPQYMNRFKELKERLVSQDKIDSRSLESLVSALTLAACETAAHSERKRDEREEPEDV